MAGRSPETLVTAIQNISPILASVNRIKIWGEIQFIKSIEIASLGLKHRCNKNQKQRIIAMVGSPVHETEQT